MIESENACIPRACYVVSGGHPVSGTELARRSLQIRPDLPIVIATGYVRPEDVERARKLGVRELILKPNTVEELSETLHRVLVGLQAGQTCLAD